MFSSLKSLIGLSKDSIYSQHKTFDHQTISNDNSSQCPFKNKKNNPQNQRSCPMKNKQKSQRDDDELSSDDQKPKGGCPFMGTSNKKKNPNLGLLHEGHDQPYISKFRYYLSENKLNLSVMKNPNFRRLKRTNFNSYPIYLQHTLFFSGEDFKKVRSLECCSRFMAFEQMRQKGNRYFNKGKFNRALDYYERAMSLFRWLQHREIVKESRELSEESRSQSQQEESFGSKIHLNLESQEDIDERAEENNEYEQLQKQYKEFFVIYHDDNVVHHNGQELEQEVDLDMRKSLLIQIYLNMASAYIQLDNFSVAKQVCDDALALSGRVSQIYLRKAQAIILNIDSTIEETEQALKMISIAIQMQPNEKIFKTTNPNILKMINIHDAKQVYQNVQISGKKKLEEKTKLKIEKKSIIENRLKQINEVEMKIIAEGKTPRESKINETLEQTHEYRTLMKMRQKYMKILQFYSQTKDKEQLTLAKREFQQVLRVISEVNHWRSITIDYQNEQFGKDLVKIINRDNNFRRQLCEELVNQGKFNFSVLQWAIKQLIDEQKQIKEKKTQKQESKKVVNGKSKLIERIPYVAVLIVPLIGLTLSYSLL